MIKNTKKQKQKNKAAGKPEYIFNIWFHGANICNAVAAATATTFVAYTLNSFHWFANNDAIRFFFFYKNLIIEKQKQIILHLKTGFSFLLLKYL